jgi:hypothetical protein
MRYALVIALIALLFAAPAAAVDFSGQELFLPIVSRVSGAFGTQWRTDVVLASRHDHFATEVTLIYDAVDRVPIELTFPLAPRQTLTFADILQSELGLEQSYGTIWLGSSTPGVPIVAHARIYNVGRETGEFGQVVTALPLDQLGNKVWLNGLTGIRGNRTNVGVGNPNNAPARFSLTWFDKHGDSHGSAGTFVVEPWSVLLLNDIFDQTGMPPDEGLTLRLVADVPIYAYASVVRNDTGDAYTVVGDGRVE